MIQGLRHGLKKFWSQAFSGDLLILSLSIVLAVTSLSSVSFLGDRLQNSLKLQASSILGADLVLRSASKLDSQYIDLGQINELETAKTITFLSMVIAKDDNLLTSIKTTSDSYPLRGKLIITDFNGDSIEHGGSPPVGSVWIEPAIAETLQISQFNEVSIGNQVFQVEGIIQDFPDRNSSFIGFYPIAIANINDVQDMGVIQTGSRVVYRYLFSGSKRNLSNFIEDLGDIPAEIRLQEAGNVGDNLGASKSGIIHLIFLDLPISIIKVAGYVLAMVGLFGAIGATLSFVTTLDIGGGLGDMTAGLVEMASMGTTALFGMLSDSPAYAIADAMDAVLNPDLSMLGYGGDAWTIAGAMGVFAAFIGVLLTLINLYINIVIYKFFFGLVSTLVNWIKGPYLPFKSL